MGQTKGGKYLDGLELFKKIPAHQAADIWDIASKRFADGASGDVNVFSTGTKKMSEYGHLRTWWRIEKPILIRNNNVNSINVRKKDGNRSKIGHITKCP